MKTKSNFRKGLERILAGGIIFVGSLVGGANAGNIKIKAWVDHGSAGNSSHVNFSNIVDASEGFDSKDSPFIQNPSSKIKTYSEISESPYELSTNAKDINSTTDSNMKTETIIDGIGGDEYWSIDITDMNDLEWKNDFIERYGKNGNPNDSNDVLDIWDVKYKDGKGWFQSGSFPIQGRGLYDQLIRESFNHADLNRDGKVDFLDHNILAGNFGRTGVVKGSDPNALGDYADIENLYDAEGRMISYGDGTVDMNDVAYFMCEWLWNVQDPNTW